MKKRTAGIVVTSLVVLLGGYVAWCSRTFYLEPPALDTTGLPEEVRAVAPALAREAGMMVKEKFRMERFLHYLRYPYEERTKMGATAVRSSKRVICISRNNPTLIACFGSASPDPPPGPDLIFFIQQSGKWVHVSEQEGLLYE